jgi:hypothetical protein
MIRAAILAAALILAGALTGSTTAPVEVQAWPPLATFEMLLSHSTPEPIDVHVWNYGDYHPDCERWTDACVVCTRGTGCSNIGIACRPKPQVTCGW